MRGAHSKVKGQDPIWVEPQLPIALATVPETSILIEFDDEGENCSYYIQSQEQYEEFINLMTVAAKMVGWEES